MTTLFELLRIVLSELVKVTNIKTNDYNFLGSNSYLSQQGSVHGDSFSRSKVEGDARFDGELSISFDQNVFLDVIRTVGHGQLRVSVDQAPGEEGTRSV